MGNCASNPKTNEGDEAPVPVPETVTEEVKVVEEQPAETKQEATPVAEASLSPMLIENEEKKESETRVEDKTEEVKDEVKPVEEKPAVLEVANPEAQEEKPAVVVEAKN